MGAAVLLIGVVLSAVSTWSKRRLMVRLVAVVSEGEAMTSWLASTSGVRGVVDGREIRIENVGMTRGVLRISVEHHSSARAEALRRTWLRVAIRKALPDFDRSSGRGGELYFKWRSSGDPSAMEAARDPIVRFMSEHPLLDRMMVSERWVEAFRIGYRKRDLQPEPMRRFLGDLCVLARSLE